jgi:hypothetical protein
MAAAADAAHAWSLPVDPAWRAIVRHRALNGEAGGVLARAWTGPHRRSLLHGYNTLGDYSAFRGLWLGDAESLEPSHETRLRRSGVWWHSLDTSNEGLLAGWDGVAAAVTAAPAKTIHPQARRHTIRQLTKDLLQSFAPSATAIDENATIRVGAATLRRDGARITFTIASHALRDHCFAETPYLWLPESTAADMTLEGGAECECAIAVGNGDERWIGRSFRVSGVGSASIAFAIG